MCACSMSDNQRHCVAVTYAVIRKVSGYLAQFTLLTRLDRGLKCASSLDSARVLSLDVVQTFLAR